MASFNLFFLSLFLSIFLLFPLSVLAVFLIIYFFLTLPLTVTKVMNVKEEKLNELFELLITAEKLRECPCFMVEQVRDLSQNK